MLSFNGEGRGYDCGKWSCGFGGRALNKNDETEALKMIGQR